MKISKDVIVVFVFILIYSCKSDKYPKYFTYDELRRDVVLPLSFPDTVPIGNNTNCYLVIHNSKGEGKIVFDSLGKYNIIGKYYNTNNFQYKTIRLQYIILDIDSSYFIDKFVRTSILEYRGKEIQCYENRYDSDIDSLVKGFNDDKTITKSKIIDNRKLKSIETISNDTIKSNDMKLYKILDPEYIENKKKWDSINKIKRDSIIKSKQGNGPATR